jgi:hypothetical protein
MSKHHFPSKVYGRCPLGHNIQPSGDTSDDISTTQIDEGESKPLFYSTYYQQYVCKMHLDRVSDEKHEIRFHQRDRDFQRDLAAMGFKKNSS